MAILQELSNTTFEISLNFLLDSKLCSTTLVTFWSLHANVNWYQSGFLPFWHRWLSYLSMGDRDCESNPITRADLDAQTEQIANFTAQFKDLCKMLLQALGPNNRRSAWGNNQGVPPQFNNPNHQNCNNFDDFWIKADIPTFAATDNRRLPGLVSGGREILRRHVGPRDKDGEDGCLLSQSNYRCLLGYYINTWQRQGNNQIHTWRKMK